MKRIVSVSLGSSRRNHKVETEFLGEKFQIERVGTDGDVKKAIRLIEELDGHVEAFGMGGIDLYIRAGKRVYTIRGALPLKKAAKKSPMVDGSGLKNTLERRVVRYVSQHVLPLKDRKVLVTSSVDRSGMAESLVEQGAKCVFADLIYVLNLPVPMTSLRQLYWVARILAPIVVSLPFEWLYPTGDKQEKRSPKHTRYFHEAEVICGDFHFIKRYMPNDLPEKTIITNTVTKEDLIFLKEAGVGTLVTTTPEMKGRSFGTNVMEALLVSVAGKKPEELSSGDYEDLLDRLNFEPRVVHLQQTDV